MKGTTNIIGFFFWYIFNSFFYDLQLLHALKKTFNECNYYLPTVFSRELFLTFWSVTLFLVLPQRFHFNCLTPKISLVILLVVCHIVLVMLVWRIWYWIKGDNYYPLVNIFLYSHHLSAWYCFDMVRRNFVLITHGSLRVNHFKWPFKQAVGTQPKVITTA